MLVEDPKFSSILPRKIDIANFVKCATTTQLHVVAIIFSKFLV